MRKTLIILLVIFAAMAFVESKSGPFFLPFVFAHCDTLDGPVVKTAKAALERGDVTPILKWVTSENEAEIKDLFNRTLIWLTVVKRKKIFLPTGFSAVLVGFIFQGTQRGGTGMATVDHSDIRGLGTA